MTITYELNHDTNMVQKVTSGMEMREDINVPALTQERLYCLNNIDIATARIAVIDALIAQDAATRSI